MKRLMIGLSGFLSETSLHGFKYLGPNHGWFSKVIWGSVILLFMFYAVFSVLNAYNDWQENPVITSVESIDSSLNEIQFPTLTFCHDDYFQPDQWALTEMVFNAFEFNCDVKIDPGCSKSQALREDFKPFFKMMYDQISALIDQVSFENLDSVVGEKFINQIFQAILQNKTNLSGLENILQDSVGKFTTYSRFIQEFVPETSEDLICDEDCDEIKEQVLKFIVKVDAMTIKGSIPFGSVLRQFSTDLGLTFDTEEFRVGRTRKVDNCPKISPLEHKIHQVMLQIAKQMGLNVSLHDLPDFYKISTSFFIKNELRKDQPVYSLCSAGITTLNNDKNLPFCPQSWYESSANTPTKNPYLDHPGTFCSGGVNKLTKANMTSLMKLMKFAFHLATIDDFRTLYDLMAKTNIPYNLRPFEDTIKDSKTLEDPIFRRFSDLDFKPVFTSRGLCYSWNGYSVSKILKPSSFVESFNGSFQQNSDKIKMGGIRKVSFSLDKHEMYLPDRSTNDGVFWIGINTANTFFDMSVAPTIVPQGYKTIITVKPTSVVSDKPDLETSLEPKERRCRFGYEIPQNMSLFSEYTMAGCRFECMYNYSLKECSCLPWDMPRPNGTVFEMCDSAGNDCFWNKMNNFSFMASDCFCLPNCDSVKFSFSEKQLAIKWQKLCEGMSSGFGYTNNKLRFTRPVFVSAKEAFKKAIQANSSIDWNKDVKKNSYEILQEQCKKFYTEDISLVEVQMEGQTFTKMKQSVRSTWEEKFSTVGGTLGLCLGFSALAIVEVIHWTLLSLFDCLN